jgi:hypothetical protein
MKINPYNTINVLFLIIIKMRFKKEQDVEPVIQNEFFSYLHSELKTLKRKVAIMELNHEAELYDLVFESDGMFVKLTKE